MSNELDDQDKPLAAATGGGWDEQAQSLVVVDEVAPSSSAPLGIGAAVPTWISLAMINVIVAIPLLLIMWGLGSILAVVIWGDLLEGALTKEGGGTGASPWGLAGALVMFTGVLVWSVMSRQLERQRAEDLDALEPMRLGHISRTLSICFGVSTSVGILALIWRVLTTPTESWLLAFVFELNCVVDSALVFWSLLKFDAEVAEAWWQRCKRSPYFAGATTATGIGIVLGGAILVLSLAGIVSVLEDAFKDPERMAELEAALADEPEQVPSFAASVATQDDDAQQAVGLPRPKYRSSSRWVFPSAPAVLGMSDGVGDGVGLNIASFGQSSPGRGTAARDCMDKVWAPENGRASTFKRGVQFLRYSKKMDKADAEDVAMTTLMKVCVEHDGALVDVNAYFMRSLQNNSCTFHKRRVREGFGVACNILHPSSSCTDTEKMYDVSAALCKLDAQDKYLIEARAAGYSFDEIATELRITPANARQRFKRVRQDLQTELRGY